MEKQEARDVIGQFLTGHLVPETIAELEQLVDAHLLLLYPVPQPLLTDLQRKHQAQAPLGYTVIIQTYKDRTRVLYVKTKHLRRFGQMIANPNDTDDVD